VRPTSYTWASDNAHMHMTIHPFLAGVLDPRGPVAASEYQLLQNATVVMLALIVPVMVLTLGFAWWFRAGNKRAKRKPDWDYSGALEVVNWMVPLMIILFLGGMGWVASHALDPAKPLPSTAPPLEIQVVSLDWKWLFIYPGSGVATVNHLVVPAGRPLHLQLTSGTVMNSFFVPQLGSQIYTMAGMTTTLYLQADHPGTFPGRSFQFSGDGFADMRFDVDAVDAPAFDAWLAQTRAGGAHLDAAAYAALAKPGTSAPRAYGLAAPQLFHTILAASTAPQ
jgi:cytochrome o ubiquinol oxidase subunit 2